MIHKKITKTPKNEEEQKQAEIKEMHNFYTVGIDMKGKFTGLSIDKVLFLERLKKLGFLRYDLDVKTKPLFVKVNENLIEETNPRIITDKFVSFIKELPTQQIVKKVEDDNGNEKETAITITTKLIENKLYNSLDKLFSPTFLERLLPDKEINIFKDEADCKYLFYINKWLKITADSVIENDYKEVEDKFVWKNQLLNREYVKTDKEEGMFEKFFKKICGNDPKRILSLKTITGYLLHNYNETKRIGIIITDSKIGMDGEANGRTGKTLFGKSLGKMLNAGDEKESFVYCEIGGKLFDTTREQKYQLAGLDTQLIHLNDMRRGFKIEHLFNDISDGVLVRKMYSPPFIINPKILISTNTTIRIDGESAKGRIQQFEFSDYYNSERTPDKEFECWFFRDWDETEWSRFDNFMIDCIKTYLSKGLIRAESINLEERTLLEHTHSSFIDFMDARFKDKDDEGNDNQEKIWIVEDANDNELIKRFRIDKKELYEAYKNYYPDMMKKKFFEQRTFTNWLKQYVKIKKNLEVKEQRSHGQDYIYFIKK